MPALAEQNDRVSASNASPELRPQGSTSHTQACPHLPADSASAERCETIDPRVQAAVALGDMVAWEKDLRTDWVTRSDNSMRLLGFGSTPVGSLRPRVHADDILAAEALEIGSLEPRAFRYLHPDGRLRWLEGCSSAIVENGQTVKIFGFLRDITAQRQALEGVSVEGALHAEMRAALEAGQFVPYYQPQVCLRTGELVGVEVLARWKHPEKGVLPPQAFLSAFADGELAASFGRGIRRRVIEDIRKWRGVMPASFTVAVNMCGFELRDPSLGYRFAKDIRNAGLDPARFVIEITEDALMTPNSPEDIRGPVEALHKRGFTVAFDDFGTGYASLKQLRCAGIDQIKIDRSFVHGLGKSAEDTSIVSAMLQLGHGMNVEVVAEGVETARQAQMLSEMGCRLVQGYLFSEPLGAERFEALMRDWKPNAAKRAMRARRPASA